MITTVTEGGPAAKAGLRGGSRQIRFQGESVLTGGDVVVGVAGAQVAGADELVRIVTNTLRPGQTAVFSILRDGKPRSIAVRLATRPSP
jgi:S1-C subfamily serine protease